MPLIRSRGKECVDRGPRSAEVRFNFGAFERGVSIMGLGAGIRRRGHTVFKRKLTETSDLTDLSE